MFSDRDDASDDDVGEFKLNHSGTAPQLDVPDDIMDVLKQSRPTSRNTSDIKPVQPKENVSLASILPPIDSSNVDDVPPPPLPPPFANAAPQTPVVEEIDDGNFWEEEPEPVTPRPAVNLVNIRKNFERYLSLAAYLAARSAQLYNEANNTVSDKMTAAITKLRTEFPAYKEFLIKMKQDIEARDIFNNKIKATKIATLIQRASLLNKAMDNLEMASANLLKLKQRTSSEERLYFTDPEVENDAVNISTSTTAEITQLISTYCRASLPSQSTLRLTAGKKLENVTEANYQRRFIPNQVRIESQQKVARVAIIEDINAEKTYSKQTIYTHDIKQLAHADPQQLWEFAAQLVRTGKASVKTGPIAMHGNWPPKLADAVVAYCTFKGYSYKAPDAASANADRDAEQLRQYWALKHPDDKGLKEIIELSQATQTEELVTRKMRPN